MSFQSWGRYPYTEQRGECLPPRSDLVNAVAVYSKQSSYLAYGNGRSYGDSCMNQDGIVVATTALDNFISFDSEHGILRCESGVLLKEILELCAPQQWFLAVVPGTQYVTVGGALANDVHGKNHHVLGNFGHHVRCFELLRSDGQLMYCSPEENKDYFYATIGGLGLTGIITWVEIQLKRISGLGVEQESIKYQHLDDFFELSEESAQRFEYSVAWIDCLASGASLGRGHFNRANHSQKRLLGASAKSISMPFVPPLSLVNRWSVKAFNQLHYHKQRQKRKKSFQYYQPYFFPLDGILHWNRMYGPRGFLQYQCVIPMEHAKAAVSELLARIAKNKQGSFLAVLKVFGDIPSLGWLSYPTAGANLALDFPYQGERTHRFLAQLDEVVRQAKGRIYPAKDAHMNAEDFKCYYPRWHELELLRDPAINSSFWRRVSAKL